MNVELLLIDARGDELGRLPMQTVRVAEAGSTTVPPDLSGDMARMGERIALALAQENMAPALDAIGVRIAVSRALLAPQDGAVRIPLAVRTLDESAAADESRADGVAENRAAGKQPPAGPGLGGADGPGGMPETPAAPEWDDLFSLGEEGDSPTDEGGLG